MIGWIVFAVVIAGFLALDLFAFRGKHEVRLGEALLWSGIWIGVALAFNVGVWLTRGPVAGTEFLTAYLVEESLSVDNLFIFLVLFAHFQVPPEYRHKVLFWGVFGALVMRLVFIFAGVSLIQRFEFVMYLFGAILVFSGIKMAFAHDTDVDPERNLVLRLFRRVFPVAANAEPGRFFVRQNGRWLATRLFVVLLMVETTDLIFAVDSIPAVLGISRDPFIVYTSNVFAILGLRSLFFALARLLDLFHFLHYALALILVFIGAKMLLVHVVEIPTWAALAVVGGALAVATAASLVWPRRTPPRDSDV